ncbi:MAG: DUF5343 domain-containing protein [Clostridia bacterium]|nr:DUF5343 domain-containing protein [Clostridia bacterium]
MTDYPYMVSNNKIAPIIEKIQQAARPQKFTIEVLRTLGFTSTNDRAFIPLFKKLGFFADDGTPTTLYDQLKDATSTKYILAAQIKELYSELYAINTEIHKAPETEIKGAISRVTGKDADGVGRIYNTFKTLCSIADFTHIVTTPSQEENNSDDPVPTCSAPVALRSSEFHYNIQIHLPATNDISVYNTIFKSLKENLLM